MADKIVQLVDKNGDNIFPVATVANGATITMTDVDPGEGAALGDNEYVAVYGGDPITLDYSTSEIDTGAKWIDGSAIYKKTINFGALPNADTKQVAHNISNLAYFIKVETIARNESTTSHHMIDSTFGNPTQGIYEQAYVDSTAVKITTGTDRSTFDAYVTLYYTKSS